MSTTGWILLSAITVGAHLLMHREHGTHGARGAGSRTPQDGHQHHTQGESEVAATGGRRPSSCAG